MSQNPIIIDLCICTFQRTHIAATLHSVSQLSIPSHTELRLIIADNDREPSAQVLVSQIATELPFALTYVHAPHANISVARNACLDTATADYVAFIDDDELVTSHWLVAMIKAMQSGDAEIILGPVKALYPDKAPYWVTRGDFHSNLPVYHHGQIITGYSCNVLMHLATSEQKALRFGAEFGVNGGEDTDYFFRLNQLGARISYAPDALICEPTPLDRCRLTWLLKRRNRMGVTYAVTHIHQWRKPLATVACLKALFSYGMVLPSLPWPTVWRFWLLRATFHQAVMIQLLQRP